MYQLGKDSEGTRVLQLVPFLKSFRKSNEKTLSGFVASRFLLSILVATSEACIFEVTVRDSPL
jgi:hypothetical protein